MLYLIAEYLGFPGVLNLIRYINFPVVFSGPGLIPPATPANYIFWCITGFIFNYIVRRRHFSWWAKYNCEYCRYAGLDCETQSR